MNTKPINIVTLIAILTSSGYFLYRIALASNLLPETFHTQMGLNQARASTTTLPSGTSNVRKMATFRLPDMKGAVHSLSEWKGKIIMLNFWASWCGPCQYEIPEFVSYQNKYASQGLQIIGIGVDKLTKLKNTARSLEINYPILVLDPDKSKTMMSKWGDPKGVIPYTVVISSDGTIAYMHRGKLDRDSFEFYVLPLLKAAR
jgi:peroxiredoxin